MLKRELGIQELYERLLADRSTIGLISFNRNPTRPVNESKLPALFLIEGPDDIKGQSTRDSFGFPKKRSVELVFELITHKDTDIRSMYLAVRKSLFGLTPVVATNTFFEEIRAEGPHGYGLPDILSMNLIIVLHYTDETL